MTVKSLAALIVLGASAMPLVAQASRVECGVSGGVPPVIRSEGLTERVADIVVACSEASGGAITTDLVFTFSAPITSRNYTPGSEIVLLVNEPGVARVTGPPTPLIPGVTLLQPDEVTSNQIRFRNVRVEVPNAPGQAFVLRLKNVRVNATGGQPTVTFGLTASAPGVALFQEHLVAAYVQTGFTSSVGLPPGVPPANTCSARNAGLATNPAATGGMIDWTIRFTEAFQTAFKARQAGDAQLKPDDYQNTESGFFDPTLPVSDGLSRLGQANWGTRLMARFQNVPPGVRLYVTTGAIEVRPLTDSRAQLVSAAADGTGGSAVAATTTALYNGVQVGIAPVNLIDGRGTATWEITREDPTSNEQVGFGVAVAYGTGITAAANITITTLPGAASSDPLLAPRFRDVAIATLPAPIGPCVAGIDLAAVSVAFVGRTGTTVLSGIAGEALDLDVVMTNRGLSAAGPFSYLVEVLDGTGAVLSQASRSVAEGLGAGAFHSATIHLRTSAFSSAGVLRARLTVDPGAGLADGNRANNVVSEAAGQTLRCSALWPGTWVLPSGGGLLAIPLLGTRGCDVEVNRVEFWLTEGTSGFRQVAANPGSGVRPGVLGLQSRTGRVETIIRVVQAGSTPGCAVTLASGDVSSTAPYTGVTRLLGFQTGPGCQWSAVANVVSASIPGEIFTGPASLSLEIRPNFSSLNRNVSVVAGTWSGNIPQAGNPRPLNERLVQSLYFYFLGRLPSEAEIAAQARELSRGVELGELLPRFYNAVEFDVNSRFIAGLYVGLLNRNAELNGLLYQRTALLTNIATHQQLVSNFLNSAEWRLTFGTPDDAGFVRVLYQNILLRTPSQAEIDFQTGALGRGVSRVQMATNFLNAQEFRISSGPRLTAFLAYATVLGRDTDASEMRRAVERLTSSGLTGAQLWNELIQTAEYSLLTIE